MGLMERRSHGCSQASLRFHMAAWLATPLLFSPQWWKTHVHTACSFQVHVGVTLSSKEFFFFFFSSFLFWIPKLEGQSSSSSSEVRPLPPTPLFGPLPDCYLAFRWRLAAPLGEHECACQQEFIGGNRGRWRMDGWRMVSVALQLFPPSVWKWVH